MTNPPAHELDPVMARKMWRTLEPYHGMIYFTPRATERYAQIGIVGRAGYFASRVAPMGTVPAAVVIATFYNFQPALVEDAMRDVWLITTPDQLIAARFDAADRALRELLGDDVVTSDEVVEATEIAAQAAAACTAPGRPLYAATAALAPPAEPHLALWHWLTLLREFRGDGHLTALVQAKLDGVEALITHAAGGDIGRAPLQLTRAWTDAEWEAGLTRLRARGLIEEDGEAFTDAGRALRDHIESQTDELAMAPWNAIGQDACDRLRQLVRPWSKAIVSGGTFGFSSVS